MKQTNAQFTAGKRGQQDRINMLSSHTDVEMIDKQGFLQPNHGVGFSFLFREGLARINQRRASGKDISHLGISAAILVPSPTSFGRLAHEPLQ